MDTSMKSYKEAELEAGLRLFPVSIQFSFVFLVEIRKLKSQNQKLQSQLQTAGPTSATSNPEVALQAQQLVWPLLFFMYANTMPIHF